MVVGVVVRVAVVAILVVAELRAMTLPLRINKPHNGGSCMYPCQKGGKGHNTCCFNCKAA